MLTTLQSILERTLEQLSSIANQYVPPLLAGAVILAIAWLLAISARWLVHRIFKGAGVDRFLSQSGIGTMIDRSGRLRTRDAASRGIYWLILAGGFLGALNAFNTELTTRIVNSAIFLLPKVITAAVIIIAGAWLGQYIGRTTVVWAVNEGIPSARRCAAAVRIVIIFVAIVVAADTLDFARSVFLAAFIILVGGAVTAAAIALGLGMRDAVRRQIESTIDRNAPFERSLRNHL